MFGPADSPFENGIYRLNMQFNDQYPFQPPKVTFITKIYHPNIGVDRRFCIGMLYDHWCIALSIEAVLVSIQSIFTSPDVIDSLLANAEAARLYIEKRGNDDQHVRWCTETYAV